MVTLTVIFSTSTVSIIEIKNTTYFSFTRAIHRCRFWWHLRSVEKVTVRRSDQLTRGRPLNLGPIINIHVYDIMGIVDESSKCICKLKWYLLLNVYQCIYILVRSAIFVLLKPFYKKNYLNLHKVEVYISRR